MSLRVGSIVYTRLCGAEANVSLWYDYRKDHEEEITNAAMLRAVGTKIYRTSAQFLKSEREGNAILSIYERMIQKEAF